MVGKTFLLGLPGGLRIWRVDSILFVCMLEKAFCEGRIKQLEPYFLKGVSRCAIARLSKRHARPFLCVKTLSILLSTN